MKTKICTKCKKEKPVSDFYSSKSRPDGLYSYCKVCSNANKREYYRTLKGLVHKIYGQQKSSSKKRGHQPPAYTFEALYDWFINQANYKELYNNWKNSGYTKDLAPSIDRLDDNKGYSFDNIQLITWYENKKKELEKHKVKANQYDLEGNYIKTYNSITDAAKYVNSAAGNVFKACRNITQTAAGFQWRLLSDEFPVGKDIPPIKPNLKPKKGKKIKATFRDGKSRVFNSMSAAAKYFNCARSAIRHKIEGKHAKLEQLKDVILEYNDKEIENV
jgi:hypothetical protein